MNRLPACVALLGLLGAACDWGSGCQLEPPAEPLAADAVAPRAVEWAVPPERATPLGEELRAAIKPHPPGLRTEVPEVGGQVDGAVYFETQPKALTLGLAGVQAGGVQGGLRLELAFEPVALELALDWVADAGADGSCQLAVAIPQRQANLLLVAATDADGRLVLQADGTPQLSGGPIGLEAAADCGVELGAEALALLRQSIDEALQQALPELVAELDAVTEHALGLVLGGQGVLDGGLQLLLLPQADSTSLQAERIRIGLAGGAGSPRAACVPANLASRTALHGAPAAIGDRLPESGQSYQLAIAVARPFLEQVLAEAHRAGLLCRRPGDGPLPQVALAEVLPSLLALGPVAETRVMVRPRGALRLDFGLADTQAGERLPRLQLVLPDTWLDIYTRIGGADLRALGLRADVTLLLAPRLEGHRIELEVAAVQVVALEISYSELITEQAGELRAAARELIRQVAAAWVAELGPVELPLPPAAGPQLLEAETVGDHLILYF